MTNAEPSEQDLELEALLARGCYTAALPLAEKRLATKLAKLSPVHLEAATAFDAVAEILRATGDHVLCRAHFERALAIRQKVLGDDHPDTARSLNNVGDVLKDEGDYAAALDYYKRALDIRERRLGVANPDTLSSVHDLGLLRKDMGDYPRARNHLEQALQGMQDIYGDDHLRTANCHNSLGGLLSEIGDYHGALRELESALNTRRANLGHAHPDTTDTLSDLGFVLGLIGRHSEGAAHLEEALASTAQRFGELHPNVARILGNLAIILVEVGDIARVRDCLQRALNIYINSRGTQHLDTARAHDNLGGFLEYIGEYDEARKHVQLGLDIRKKVLGELHPDTLTALGRLALLLDANSKYEESRLLHLHVLKARRGVLGDGHPSTQSSFNNLGRCLMGMGDYAGAHANLKLALQASQTTHPEGHPQTAATMNNLGCLYGDMGDQFQAELYHRCALELRLRFLGEHHAETAESMSNLAGVLTDTGDSESALAYYRQAVDAYEGAFGPYHPDTAVARTNLGILLAKMGKLEEAKLQLRRALEVRRRTLRSPHSSIANSLHNLGHFFVVSGDVPRAREFLEQALDMNREIHGELHSDTGSTLSELMFLFAFSGAPDKALAAAKELSRADDHQLASVFAMGSERQRAAVRRMVTNHFEGTLSIVRRYLSSHPEAVHFAFSLCLWRKALGVEALLAQRRALSGSAYSHLQEAVDALAALKRKIATAALEPIVTNHSLAHHDTLASWIAEREHLEEALASQIPEMSLDQERSAIDATAITALLDESSVLVEFVRYREFDLGEEYEVEEQPWRPERYLAFVVSGGLNGALHMADLGDATAIDEAVMDFHDRVSTRPESRTPTSDEAGLRLRAMLWDPLAPYLSGKTNLLIAPDGVLNLLSFAIMPLELGQLILDQFNISYISVARDLCRFKREPARRLAPPVVVADPAFNLSEPSPGAAAGVAGKYQMAADRTNDSTGDGRDDGMLGWRFARLKGTRVEGERIAEMLGVKALMAADALDRIVKNVRSPRILHLATHGFFLPDRSGALGTSDGRADAWQRLSGPGMTNPLLRSGLALAGANIWLRGGTVPADAEDGLLTAEDVTAMDLSGTELVVLSACETGLGDVHVGEGVFGLRRAFVVAGAKRLVMTLWKVPDHETQELMVRFYKGVLAGLPVSASLRAAQQSIRGSGRADPYYWGAFILQGDSAPLAVDEQRGGLPIC